MILIKTHNGPRPTGSIISELTQNCQPVRRKAFWSSIDNYHQERVIITEYDCHRCVAHTYTGVIRRKPEKKEKGC